MSYDNIQRLIATVGLGLVWAGLTGLLGYQIIMSHPVDPFISLSWGVLSGQYIKLSGVDQGATLTRQATNGNKPTP